MVATTLSSLLLATALLTPPAQAREFTREAWSQNCGPFSPDAAVKDEKFLCECFYLGLIRDVPADDLNRRWNAPSAEVGTLLRNDPRVMNVEAGCVQLDENVGGGPNRDPAIETWIATHGCYTFQVTTDGVHHLLANAGVGPRAVVGQTAVLRYKVVPLEGDVVASSDADGGPLTMTVGAGEMICGMDLGLQLFAKGGKGVLLLPFGLACGERGRPPVIPPRSTLVVEIELLELR